MGSIMAHINILDQNTINQIAAGEVIERPASVVKELIENSIDAGATAITCEIRGGGIELIRITDNGCGIEQEDIRKAFLSHATSKIRTADDLIDVMSLGFRGEALASIASIAEVELLTKTRGMVMGTRYLVNAGNEIAFHDAGCPEGTTIIVKGIFQNVPVRRKFLKSPVTEASYVSDLIEKIALSHPEISFKYTNNGKTVVFTSGNGRLKDVIYGLYGRDITSSLIEIPGNDSVIRISGYIAKPVVNRSNRSLEHYFVNGRYIRNNIISKAIEEAYAPYLMLHKYPFTVLHMEIPSENVDVNVHPTKQEVRFDDPQEIFNSVYKYISDTLKNALMIPVISEDRADSPKDARSRVMEDAAAQSAPEPFESRRSEAVVERSSRYAAEVHEGTDSQSAIPGGEGRDSRSEIPGEAGTASRSEIPGEPLHSEPVKEKYVQYVFETGRDPFGNVSAFVPESDEEFRQGMKEGYRIVGQIFGTYWIVERGDKVYYIDQHAAHEKIIYERLSRYNEENAFATQMISPSVILSFSAAESAVIDEHILDLKNMGFEIEKFSGFEYSLSGVPLMDKDLDPGDLLCEVIASYSLGSYIPKNTSLSESLKDRLATCSCKAAVKGNTRLSKEEARSLIEELLRLDNPFNCPHGRPVIVEMSRNEMEKKFKRIV